MTELSEPQVKPRSTVGGLVLIAIGTGLALVGIFAHPIGVSASPGVSTGKLLLVLVGIGLVSVGLLRETIVAVYKTIAILLLNTVVLLGLVEAALFIVSSSTGLFRNEKETDAREISRFVDGEPLLLSYYQSRDWARQYVEEYDRAWTARNLRYVPYVIWRNLPFEGNTINITDRGWRVTPASECGAKDAFQIFMFGGSTMWGTGVPDWGTIPAYLQAAMSLEHDRPICVSNLAEQAWVSTQSVIQLLLELQAGNEPDLVVFYDGINDVFSAYQNASVGLPQNLSVLRARFEQREETPPLVALAAKTRTFRAAFRGAVGSKQGGRHHLSKAPIPNVDELAKRAGKLYRANVELVSALGREHGFDSVFFWQPLVLLDKKSLVREEQTMKELADAIHPGLADFFRRAYEEVDGLIGSHPNVYDLVDLFEHEKELVYVDPWHVTAEANRLVALEMMEAVNRLRP